MANDEDGIRCATFRDPEEIPADVRKRMDEDRARAERESVPTCDECDRPAVVEVDVPWSRMSSSDGLIEHGSEPAHFCVLHEPTAEPGWTRRRLDVNGDLVSDVGARVLGRSTDAS